ncbi:unnamed protein product, partial [Symbiodinium pilosum]
MSAPSSSQQQRNFDFTYGNERARAIVRTHNARLTERAFEYIAQRTSLERAALRSLRSTFPGLSSDDLMHKWIDRLTGASATDVPDPTGDVIEAKAVDTMKRAEVYLDLLKHAEDNNPAENCLDCTFCGAWFPPYWLLDITPEATADWRNHYYRCCFQCINGDNDDYYWFTGTAVSPNRTNYRHQDCASVANQDADYEKYPKRWVIALDENNQHQRKLCIEAMWSDNKFRWVRHVVIPRTNNPNQATTLDVDTFYKLCQKVITIRRREAGEQHRLRNTYWTAASEQIHQEHPGLNKAEVRAQVRARILALVDRFTVDILSSTEGDRARIMAAFRQWDEDTIKSALDPDWDRHAFFQRIEADNRLTEWAVVDNKHWLRKISPLAPVKDQHGRYNCPEKKDEDRLLQQLKLAILNIQQEITDRDDFNQFITEALKDVANKNQYPDKFFREEFNSHDTARNYGLVEYLNDPPYYDMTMYTYEAGVTQILTQKVRDDLTHLALRLVDQGVRNIDQMNGLTPEQVLAVAPEQRDLEAFCRLLGRSIPKRTTEIRTRGRRDLPVVTSSTRGSIIGALEAAAPAVQQEAIQNLVRDQYANTTRNTRDSRWNLWTRLATSWKLPPLPITAELVQAIASSLKRGRCRSSAQVFSMARQQPGCRLSADIEQQITMCIRSIERGLGPSTLKDAFIVEDLAATTDSSTTPPPAEDHWAEYLYDCVLVTLICCWWMLRGIEVAAAWFSNVWFETTAFGRLAFFTLPCHKTDTVGMCITRSHPCTCSDNMAALCPYHALDTFIRRNHRPTTDRNDEYLFYGRRGGPITRLETIEVFRKAIASTGAELTRPEPQGQLLHRFNEH